MYPFLFGVEFLDMYTIMLALGILAAVLLFKRLCARANIADKPYNFYSFVGLVSIAAGLVCAFLFQQLYHFIEASRTGAAFEWRGVTFFGGLIGGVVTFLLVTLFGASPEIKRDFYKVANLAAPCIVLGHAFGRYGCFCAGCCYGIPNDRFGVRFPYPYFKVLPTQLYEAIFLTLLFAVMLLLLFKFKKLNILLILYGFAYSAFRFLIEFLRGDDRGDFIPGLSPSQWQSILLLAVTAALAVLVYKFNIIPFAAKTAKAPLPGAAKNSEPAEAEQPKYNTDK
jgi:phosphatidylglycerol:prolipoprotein diacylglycerol transferase